MNLVPKGQLVYPRKNPSMAIDIRLDMLFEQTINHLSKPMLLGTSGGC